MKISLNLLDLLALQLILNGQVEYGYVNKAREVIKLKSTMIKSPGNLLTGIYNKTVSEEKVVAETVVRAF